MTINAQKVGDPRCHTLPQANIKNPRTAAKKPAAKKTAAKKPAAKKPAAKKASK